MVNESINCTCVCTYMHNYHATGWIWHRMVGEWVKGQLIVVYNRNVMCYCFSDLVLHWCYYTSWAPVYRFWEVGSRGWGESSNLWPIWGGLCRLVGQILLLVVCVSLGVPCKAGNEKWFMQLSLLIVCSIYKMLANNVYCVGGKIKKRPESMAWPASPLITAELQLLSNHLCNA